MAEEAVKEEIQIVYDPESETTVQYITWLKDSIEKGDIITFFDNLLTIATEEGASDIHIEPFEDYSRIRLRVDWVLQILAVYPARLHVKVIAKFKIESWQMRPDEKRLPQDARVSTETLNNKELDLRASTLPCVWWEKLVMRLVDKSKGRPDLAILWIEWINSQILDRNIWYPNGMIFVTWPTWSWKTTTLYAALDILNKADVNITTYEDPVEIKLDWLNQSQVRSDIGFTFAAWLRAALRQDPDIIMVWEVRDFETLNTGMEAAMTWHLVFSTVHTNSAAETITRVMNLGAKPYMMTGTFNVIVAQRLWRRIRDWCKIEINAKEQFPHLFESAKQSLLTMKPELLDKELGLRWMTKDDVAKFIDNWICVAPDPEKWEKAFKWRVWLYEMLEFDDEIKWMILDWEKSLAVEKYALENKWMINLERDAVLKMIQWLLGIQEVYRLVKHKKYG